MAASLLRLHTSSLKRSNTLNSMRKLLQAWAVTSHTTEEKIHPIQKWTSADSANQTCKQWIRLVGRKGHWRVNRDYGLVFNHDVITAVTVGFTPLHINHGLASNSFKTVNTIITFMTGGQTHLCIGQDTFFKQQIVALKHIISCGNRQLTQLNSEPNTVNIASLKLEYLNTWTRPKRQDSPLKLGFRGLYFERNFVRIKPWAGHKELIQTKTDQSFDKLQGDPN